MKFLPTFIFELSRSKSSHKCVSFFTLMFCNMHENTQTRKEIEDYIRIYIYVTYIYLCTECGLPVGWLRQLRSVWGMDIWKIRDGKRESNPQQISHKHNRTHTHTRVCLLIDPLEKETYFPTHK